MFFLQEYAAVETTDLFLELQALLRGEGVCFGDQRDDIDFLMQPLHELDVQGLQPAWRQRYMLYSVDLPAPSVLCVLCGNVLFSSQCSTFKYKIINHTAVEFTPLSF